MLEPNKDGFPDLENARQSKHVSVFFFFQSLALAYMLLRILFFFFLFSLPSLCITSLVGGLPGCGRDFSLSAIATTATRSGKCVLDCIFVEVGMFALAHTNISGEVQ